MEPKEKMRLLEMIEAGKLITDSLKLIEKISKSDLPESDVDCNCYSQIVFDEIKNIILDARELKNNVFWEKISK